MHYINHELTYNNVFETKWKDWDEMNDNDSKHPQTVSEQLFYGWLLMFAFLCIAVNIHQLKWILAKQSLRVSVTAMIV